MHHSQESIQRHENKRIDASVCCDDNEVLHDLAPDFSERPEGQHIVSGSEGHAEHYEEEVSDGQVDNKQVRCATHLLVNGHYQHHLKEQEEQTNRLPKADPQRKFCVRSVWRPANLPEFFILLLRPVLEIAL